jgi:hypothetical protein
LSCTAAPDFHAQFQFRRFPLQKKPMPPSIPTTMWTGLRRSDAWVAMSGRKCAQICAVARTAHMSAYSNSQRRSPDNDMPFKVPFESDVAFVSRLLPSVWPRRPVFPHLSGQSNCLTKRGFDDRRFAALKPIGDGRGRSFANQIASQQIEITYIFSSLTPRPWQYPTVDRFLKTEYS